MPQWVSFQNTILCNLHCPHCQVRGMGKEYDINLYTMPPDLLKRLASEALPAAEDFTLSLIGEPLASPHLEETLKELGQYGAKLDLITNGTLFTKKRLALLMPICSRIQISIDGATEFTFEAIRSGSKFRKVVNDVKLLTKTIELLPGELRPQIMFSYTIMGSNIRELPEVVKLAKLLGVPTINCSFITIFYNHLKNEAVELHQPLYNAYRQKAKELADQLGIALNLPAAFEGVAGNAHAHSGSSNMIIQEIPEDYRERITVPAQYLDSTTIDKEAHEIRASLISGWSPLMLYRDREGESLLLQKMRQTLESVKTHYAAHLRDLARQDDRDIGYCDYLHRRVYISSTGDIVPCCVPNSPILGNVAGATLEEVWNGNAYSEFRQGFYTQAPSHFCSNCKFIQYVPRSIFVEEICGHAAKEDSVSGTQKEDSAAGTQQPTAPHVEAGKKSKRSAWLSRLFTH